MDPPKHMQHNRKKRQNMQHIKHKSILLPPSGVRGLAVIWEGRLGACWRQGDVNDQDLRMDGSEKEPVLVLWLFPFEVSVALCCLMRVLYLFSTSKVRNCRYWETNNKKHTLHSQATHNSTRPQTKNNETPEIPIAHLIMLTNLNHTETHEKKYYQQEQ